MRRPVGLILTQIVLAVLAFFQLCGVLGMVFAGFGARVQASAPVVPTHLLIGISVVFALFFAALAAWSILTIIGLGRLRTWARYSILVQGGLLAVFGALFGAGMLFARVIAPTLPQQPGQTPQSMAVTSYVFLGAAAFYGLLAAVGVCWLVYFNLRSTRTLFEPLPPFDPASPQPPPPPPGPLDHVPTPIFALSILYGISAVATAIPACFPFPVYVMGFIVTGFAAHVTYAIIALFCAYIAYGLFRVDNRARVVALVYSAIGAAHLGFSMLPSSQARIQIYTQQVNASMGLASGSATPGLATSHTFTIAMNGFALVLMAVVAWILVRYRPAFKPAA